MEKAVTIKGFSELAKLLGIERHKQSSDSGVAVPQASIENLVNSPRETLHRPKTEQATVPAGKKISRVVKRQLQRADRPQKKPIKKVLRRNTSDGIFCPLCRAQASELNTHYQQVHPVEWVNLKAIERSILKRNNARPVIFLGGSPGSGRRR